MKAASRVLSRMSVIWTKIIKESKKTGCKVVFRFPTNLESILSNSKSKLLTSSCPGVSQLSCNYGGQYIGGTKKCEFTRFTEHQDDSIPAKWELLGDRTHEQFDWLHVRTSAELKNLKNEKYFFIRYFIM